jgi:hypothetical protein
MVKPKMEWAELPFCGVFNEALEVFMPKDGSHSAKETYPDHVRLLVFAV